MKLFPLVLLVALSSGCGAPPSEDTFPVLTGDYFGQALPESGPELFAPGLVSTGLLTRDLTMTPDGREIYYCVAMGGFRVTAIMVTKLVDGRWTRPEVAPFSARAGWANLEPCISPDGQQFFFMSDRPVTDEDPGNADIWVMDREGDRWGTPRNLGAPINTPGEEYYPSVTHDGTLYFTRADPETRVDHIYRSRLVGGEYQEAEMLPEQVNCGRNRFNAWVAADESFIIVPTVGMEDTLGGVDYYISFRDDDDHWTDPLNMGDRVNSSDGREWSASVSPDGQYLFFMSARAPDLDETVPMDYARIQDLQDSPANGNANIYWMSASVINELREQVSQPKDADIE